jgi:aryl carrier-like protein
MSEHDLTFDQMRAEIAAILHDEPDAIDPDESLIELGLDSIRAMALVTRWQARGIALDFSVFAERPTLAGWWQLVDEFQKSAR